MVVLVPKICLDKGGTYNRRLCAQTVKEIYALRSELQYCLQKKEQTKVWIKRLDTWKNTKLNSPKWSKIVQLIEQSSKLQKARENILKDIELSGSLRYKDAMFILKDPEVQAEVSKLLEYNKVKGISINALAALISKDGPKDIFKDTKQVIEDELTPLSTFEEPKTTKANLNKYIKDQQPSSFWGFFSNPFNSSVVRESALRQEFGAFNLKKKLKSFKKNQKWSVNDIVGEENIKNAEILKQFARREKLSQEDLFNVARLPNSDGKVLGFRLDQLKQKDGTYALPLGNIIRKMSEISGEYRAHIEQNQRALLVKLYDYIKKSKRTKVSVEDLVRKFENELLAFFQFKPSNNNERNKLSIRILNDLLRGDPDLNKYQEGNKTYWGLLEGNVVFEEKARNRIFKDTNQNALEKIFVESILSSFSKNGEQIKELNRVYNNEQSHLAVQLSNVKQEARALESSIEEQQDMFQELQKRNIQELPDTVVRSLELWKRVLAPRTIAKIIEYSNDLSKYLVLINELLHDDPNEYDLEMMSTIFSTRDEFDSAKYISITNKRLTTYITKLKGYLDDWEIYQKQVESTLTFLYSDNVDNINFAMTNIKAILSSRPSAIFGVRKIQSEVDKETQKALELIREAKKALEKTNNPDTKVKLRKYIEDIRRQYGGLETLSDEKNAEVSYNQGLAAGLKRFREEIPYDEGAEKPKGTGGPIPSGQRINFVDRGPLQQDQPYIPRQPQQRQKPQVPQVPQVPQPPQPPQPPQRRGTGVITLPPKVDIEKFLNSLGKNNNVVEQALKAMEPDKAEMLKPFLIPVGKIMPITMTVEKAVQTIQENIDMDTQTTRQGDVEFVPTFVQPQVSSVSEITEITDRGTQYSPQGSPQGSPKSDYSANWDENDRPEEAIGRSPLFRLLDRIQGTPPGTRPDSPLPSPPSTPGGQQTISPTRRRSASLPSMPSIKKGGLFYGSNRRRSTKRDKKDRHSKKKNVRRSKKKVRIGAKCALGKKG